MPSPVAPPPALWPLARLRPGARNPRRHDAAQLAQLAASIRRFGFVRPVLATPDGEIIAGEACWRAAALAGLEAVPVVLASHLSAAEVEAYRIADNRLAEAASWDQALLADVLRDLERTPFALPVLGFSDAEIAALLDPNDAPPAVDVESAPPTSPLTRPGDLWRLDRHRLICGDSREPATLARLLADDAAGRVVADARGGAADLVFTDPPYGMAYDGGRAKADVVFTDPPYGMAFGAGKAAGSTPKGATVKAHGVILGDEARGEDLVALVRDALVNACAFARPGAAVYVCLTWRTYREFAAALAAAGLEPAACIVWNKESIGLGYAHYRPQHEFILYCRGDVWAGGRDESDVWSFSRGATGEYVHPTQKPVALVERAIGNSSRRGDLVLDVFGGSGSTLIAAERLGRAARLVELDPKYCDAIVRRWEVFTGRTAERVTR